MQQDTNQQFHQLGVLLMLDPPQGLQFGIDNISWKIGKMFKGLKLIPLGVHIMTYSMREQNNMFKVSKFINFTQKQKRIHVYKWDSLIGCFKQLKGQIADGYCHGVRSYHFDSYLGPYPKENLNFWKLNTSHITSQVLEKLDPVDPIQVFEQQYSNLIAPKKQENQMPIDSIEEQDQQQEQQIKQEQQKKQEKEKSTSAMAKFKQLSDNIYYSQIPRRLKGQLSHISKVNLDKSQILKHVIHQSWKKYPKGLLGEIQYCFISFLIGQNQESYSQWKKLINLFCLSQEEFLKENQLIMEFLIVFYQQLSQFPSDFFRDQLSKQNFIGQCLRQLKIYTIESTIPKKVSKRIKKLFQMLQKKFDYIVQVENEDQAPVIVQSTQTYF